MCSTPKAPKASTPSDANKQARILLSRRQYDDLILDKPTTPAQPPASRSVTIPVVTGGGTAAGLRIVR